MKAIMDCRVNVPNNEVLFALTSILVVELFAFLNHFQTALVKAPSGEGWILLLGCVTVLLIVRNVYLITCSVKTKCRFAGLRNVAAKIKTKTEISGLLHTTNYEGRSRKEQYPSWSDVERAQSLYCLLFISVVTEEGVLKAKNRQGHQCEQAFSISWLTQNEAIWSFWDFLTFKRAELSRNHDLKCKFRWLLNQFVSPERYKKNHVI